MAANDGGTVMPDGSLVNWQTATGQVSQSGAFGFGRVWIALGSSVRTYDQITGAQLASYDLFGNGADPRHLAVYGAQMAVACDDQTVYTIDPVSGEIEPLAYVGDLAWMASYGASVMVWGDRGLYRIAPPFEHVDGPYGPLIGPYGRGDITARPAIAGDVVYVPLHDSVAAVDLLTLSKTLWTAASEGPPAAGAFCDGRYLAFGNATALHVYNVATQQRLSRTTTGTEIAVAPLIEAGTCYVGYGTGRVDAIDIFRGGATRNFQLPGAPIADPLRSPAGAIFFGDQGAIYIVDPTGPSSGGVETYATGVWPALIDYTDGALFFADSQNVTSARLADQLHEFYVDSDLIRDFAFSAAAGDPGSTANFQVAITLLHETDGTPRANQGFRLNAQQATTVTWCGQRHDVSPTRFVDLVTDGNGTCRIAVAAGLPDDAGRFRPGLAAPELFVTGSFMDPAMRLVIRPDGVLQRNLGTIDQAQLTNAKGYDSRPVVADDYRNNPQLMQSATQAINQSAGMVRTSMTAARKRSIGTKYCNRACDMGTACCMPVSEVTSPCVCDQGFQFSLETDTHHFGLLSPGAAAAAVGALVAGGSVGSWAGDFWDDIKTGVAKVVGAVVQAVEDGANAVITAIKNGVKTVFQIVIRTLQEAALLVQGIFNAIATAIEHVIEAVSFLFDWDAVLHLHSQIEQTVTDAWNTLDSGSGPLTYDGIRTVINGFLGTAKQDVDAAFDAMKAALGIETANQSSAKATGKQTPTEGSSQDNWLLAKYADNAVPDGSASAGIPAASWPVFNPTQQVTDAFDAVFTQLEAQVSADVRATLNRVWTDLDFSKDPGVLARAMAAVLDVLRGMADIAIDAVQAIADLFIDLIRALTSSIKTFLTSVIEVPFLSAFYRWLTGEDLTLMRLFCLIVAVPAGFALKLMGREPYYASGVSPNPPSPETRAVAAGSVTDLGAVEITAGAAQLVWSILNGILAGLDLTRSIARAGFKQIGGLPPLSKDPLSLARVIAGTCAFFVVRGLFLAALIMQIKAAGGGMGWSIALFVMPTVVLVADVLSICFKRVNPDASWPTTCGAALCGVFMLVIVFALWLADAGGGRAEEAGLSDSDRTLGLWFTAAVGVSLVARFAVLFSAEDAVVAYGGVVVGAALLLASGGIEIARGAVNLTASGSPIFGRA